MYTGDYKDYAFARKEGSGRISPHVLNVRLLVFADKYNMPELEHLANMKFEFRAESNWKSPEFAEAVREIYTIDQGYLGYMHDCVLDVCSQHRQQLFSLAAYDAGSLEMQDVAETFPRFAFEVLRESAGYRGALSEEESVAADQDTCPNCSYRPLSRTRRNDSGLEEVDCHNCEYSA